MNPSKSKGTATKVCQACGREFARPVGVGPKRYEGRKFCSLACSHQPVPWQHRMWLRVDVGWEHECWEWQGFKNPKGLRNSKGYGQIGIGDGTKRLGETHRLAYEFFNGPIPEGMLVRHACDNPPCCNPAHLLLGTGADNSRDAIERGRVARGLKLPQTKLTDEQVLEIRARFNPKYRRYMRGWASNGKELAQEYGVHPMHLSAIVHGRERSHVES